MIREAAEGECSKAFVDGEWLPTPTAESGGAKFVIDDEGVRGFACLSRIQTPHGEQCWAHDVYHWGLNPFNFLALALRIRRQVREWGFDQIYTNVAIDSPMFPFWLKMGLNVEQYVMKGSI